MVKLDVSQLRFLDSEDFRVLTALEMTLRNHEVAPTPLIERVANLPHGGTKRILGKLLKLKLFLIHENKFYDGYRMKYGAYDYLALRTFLKRRSCCAVGHRIGCGKESDIIVVVMQNKINPNSGGGEDGGGGGYEDDHGDPAFNQNEYEAYLDVKYEENIKQYQQALKQPQQPFLNPNRVHFTSHTTGAAGAGATSSEDGHPDNNSEMEARAPSVMFTECVLKLQRLGRCSFRSVMRNRDYKSNAHRRGGDRHKRRGESWFYLSRLAAQKEFSFLKLLYDEGFPVPRPIDQNRHAIIMEKINGILLNHVKQLGSIKALQQQEEEGEGEEEEDNGVLVNEDRDDNELSVVLHVYKQCITLLKRLAESGLIHGDFNEFNIILSDRKSAGNNNNNNDNGSEVEVYLIDFPQMVSIHHPNAEELFQRDLHNINQFFRRRFKLPQKFLIQLSLEKDIKRNESRLDEKVFASGFFTKREEEDLQKLLKDSWNKFDEEDNDDDDDGDDDDEEESEEEEEEEEDINNNRQRVTFFDPSKMKDDNSDIKDEEDEEEEEEEEEEDGSEEEEEEDNNNKINNNNRRNRTAIPRGNKTNNANFTRSGEVNEEHVREQVNRQLRRRENKDFYQHVHRNAQKGRQKEKIRRQLKSAGGNDFFD